MRIKLLIITLLLLFVALSPGLIAFELQKTNTIELLLEKNKGEKEGEKTEDCKKEVPLFSLYTFLSEIQSPFFKIISNKNVPAFIFHYTLFKPPRTA